MRLRSVRWRLPLSYAGIALLVALALGAVLLTLLRGFYARQEADYLRGNAREIGAVVAEMLQSDLPPDVLRMQLEVYALLSQSEVQVLDAERHTLARAGAPSGTRVLSVARKQAEPAVAVTVEGSGDNVLFRASGVETIAGVASAEAEPETGPVGPVVIVALDRRADAPLLPSAASRPAAPIPATEPGAREFVTSISAFGTRLGIGFDPAAAWDGRRSDQIVEQAILGADGRLLGTLRLSDGPAYGREIVASVARGLAIAGGMAIALAAAVGWWISRSVSRPVLALTAVTARMAGGDLAARADPARGDEFGQLAGSFNRMADRLEGTISALRRFVADAAHGLHTPITALHTDLELAAGERDAAAQRTLIARAQAQLARLEELTTGLLDISRLEAENGRRADAAVDLGPLILQVSEPFASRAEQAGVDLRLDLPDAPVTVPGDAALLARALGNLLDNACKFTPEGGEIAVTLRRVERRAEVSVQDTGIGIPAEDLTQLFERFHRGRNASGYPGSGLGLAIVRAIAEGHGGDVRAESAEDGTPGCRIVLRLPL